MPDITSAFIFHVLELMGTPYLYGGKGPQGIDCSGVVTYALWKAGGPDWRAMWGSSRLFQELPPVELAALEVGDLVCYPGHVMVHVGHGVVVGACGGDSTTTTLAEAERRSAFVKARQSFDYRQPVRGFRALPLR